MKKGEKLDHLKHFDLAILNGLRESQYPEPSIRISISHYN